MTRLFVAIIEVGPTVKTKKGGIVSKDYFKTNRVLKNEDNGYTEIHFTTRNAKDIELMREISRDCDELWIYIRRLPCRSLLWYRGSVVGCSIMEYVCSGVGGVGGVSEASFVFNVEKEVVESEELIATVVEEKGRSIYLI